MRTNTPDIWLGLKRCGCPVAACVDDGEIPRQHVEQTKREFIKDGYQLIVVSWAEWEEKWRPLFVKNCPHDVKTATIKAPNQGALGL